MAVATRLTSFTANDPIAVVVRRYLATSKNTVPNAFRRSRFTKLSYHDGQHKRTLVTRPVLIAALAVLLVNLSAQGEQTAGSKPKRIVSLAPSVTETLFALGAGEQLVGICTFCDFPREVERIDRIGSYIAPNVEAIIAKAPDVVIGVPPNSPEAVAALQRAGLRVVIVQVDTLEQIEAAMRTIAHEAGRDAQGEALLGDWQSFPELPAVRNGRLYGRRSYALLRPGPRLAEGFEEIARLIHPERF